MAPFQVLGWNYIVGGGVVTAIGGFCDFTIVGLPAGAVLNAVGNGAATTGAAKLSYVNHLPNFRIYTVRWYG